MNPPGTIRVLWWAGAFLIAECGLMGFLMLHEAGLLGAPAWAVSIDFVSFYAAGKLALGGTPALVYDQAVHAMTEQQVSPTGGEYVFFLYPPVFLLICAPLALLPYRFAYTVFLAATLALFLVVLGDILGRGRRHWLIVALAFPATFWTIGMGQNAFLNAALLGGFLSLLDRRPLLAGMALGGLAYKPHVALLAPFALLATGRWRVLLAAAGTVALLVAASAWLFGLETWQAYLSAAAAADAVYTTGRINLVAFPTVMAALLMVGAPLPLAYVAQAGVIMLMIALVMILFRRGIARHLHYAALAAGTLLAMPVLSFNDQIIAVLAGAWLLRDADATPLRPWESAMLTFAFPAALLAPLVAEITRVPLGLAINVGVLGIATNRALAASRT
ncbi:MAG: glycosyltransferase family 87 protein [Alphaproteobacteria bacterium]|nr:glycosyltransferase family 87 protein [Alphaproteobacteria bacterium]